MGRKLRVEELEQRIAPTTILPGGSFSWTDASLDIVTAYYDGPAGSYVELLDAVGGNIDPFENVGSIEFVDSDFSSSLYVVVTAPFISNDIPVGSIFTSGSEDVGVISIGIDDGANWNADGTVDDITIGGKLGLLMLGGDLDSTQPIEVAGDIGLIFIGGALELDAGGVANIWSGGDISFIIVDGSVDIAGGGTLAPIATPTTIIDDSGGTLRISVTGGTGEVYAVPVQGGGSVVMQVLTNGATTSVSIAAAGAGGDITMVDADQALTSLTVSGSADTDVAVVSGPTSIGTVSNQTVGGDFWMVYSGGDIGSIRTTQTGRLGWVWTDAGNSLPFIVPGIVDMDDLAGGVEADNLGSITTGGVTFAMIDIPGNIGSIVANPGGIYETYIYVNGTLGTLQASGIVDSGIYIDGQIGTINVGSDGILYSDIWSEIGITSISVPQGPINYSYISTFVDGGGGVAHSGGPINSITAASMYDSYIEAFSGFGTIRITGLLSGSGSNIESYFWDSFLGVFVGGGASSISIGGMYDSGVDLLGNVGTLTIGTLGMTEDSGLDFGGDVTTVYIRGPMTEDSYLYAEGNVGMVYVTNDLAGNSYLEIDGNVGTIYVIGDLNDAYIDVQGNANFIMVRGEVFDDSAEIYVGGDAGRIMVGSLAVGEGIEVGGSLNSLFVTSGSEGSDINIGGDVGFIYIRGDFVGTDVYVGGSLGMLYAAGSFEAGSDIDIDGNVGIVMILGNLNDDSDLDIDGSAGSVIVGGSLLYESSIEVHGNVSSLRVAGSVTDDSDINVHGNVGWLTVQGSVSDSDVYVEYDANYIVINGYLTDEGEVEVDGSVGMLRVYGFTDGADIDVDGDVGSIYISSWLDADDIEVGGNLGMLFVASTIDGDSDDLYVGGSLGTMRVIGGVVELDVEVEGDIGSIIVTGPVSDFDVEVYGSVVGTFGDLGRLSFTNASDVDVEVAGDIDIIWASRTINNADIAADGAIGTIRVGGALDNSEIWAAESIGTIQVGGQIADTDIAVEDYDGSGDPIGGGIGRLSAAEIVDSGVYAQGGIGTLAVTGNITYSDIVALAYDNYGMGTLVGGGGIGSLRAGGLVDTYLEVYGDIASASLGTVGIDAASKFYIYGSTSTLNSLTTTGLVFGRIWSAGDVGSILTAGQNAIPGLDPIDFMFTDRAGVLTFGSLEVDGLITGLIS